MKMNKFYCCKESATHNNYWSRNLIGHYHIRVISPRNSTLFTRPFLAGGERHGWGTRLTKRNSCYASKITLQTGKEKANVWEVWRWRRSKQLVYQLPTFQRQCYSQGARAGYHAVATISVDIGQERISPRNSTSFTRLFLAGRRAQAGNKTTPEHM